MDHSLLYFLGGGSAPSYFTVTDSIALADTVPEIDLAFTVTDSLSLTDSVASLQMSATVTESLALTDTLPSLKVTLTVSDSITLADTPELSASLTVTDDIYLVDSATDTLLFTVQDAIQLVDIAWRSQGDMGQIDGVELPHVLDVHVGEKTNIDTRPLSTGLPDREWSGKKGRTLRITGWTATLADFLALKAYTDGASHHLTLPTGDSMMVLVNDVHHTVRAEDWQTYPYQMDLVEEVES